jgi:hypothetical protein
MIKSKWFNNYNSPVIFGIDDLHNSYYNYDLLSQKIHPKYDFGYGGLNKKSIFTYINNHLFNKYPELKYTIFLPFGKLSALMDGKTISYDIYKTDEFKELLKYIIKSGNEIAYHGHHYGIKNATSDKKTWCREFDGFENKDKYFKMIKNDIVKFEQEFDYKIKGGRTPCYMFEDNLIDGLVDIGFDWWSFDYKPFTNNISMKYKQHNIIEMPSNLSGDIFNIRDNEIKNILRKIKSVYKISNMIKNQEVISIAEHFMTSRIDGKRQSPNVYDDINSLDYLFGYLRNKSIWYATFTEVAEYYKNYNTVTIIKKDDNTYEIKADNKEKLLLTFISNTRFIKNVESNETIEGTNKNNKWLFNNLKAGIYKELSH